ncbi:hypothetical protein GOY07_03235 [Wolbachia endosymbiont of Litomosoides sigmodontis]|uniref:hypothetical protein n=1 Tax=Wolbachia endosymbiont of Litomosoides sigmodontis TaxID=80850 RepID=UPI00158A9E7A|nr:hypothetical protein [Wolbachia endosymbiont of Litomosoides sigmodontis]QKX03168.1 hypothetical protein GOY07_03235 [Wolbachia endosymbiont of Litomosoides sigmodontis]
MSGTIEESICFIKLKVGEKFAIYTFSIHLAATFTISYLGLIIGSSLSILPLAVLISHPIVWIVIWTALAVAYKIIEILYHSVKDYVNAREKNQKTLSENSVISSEYGSRNNNHRSSISMASKDSDLGSKKFNEDLQTLVHQTNGGKYAYWLQQHDIAHIARIKYGYSESSSNDVFFCIPGNLETLNERLIEYENKVEQEDRKVTFTSVVNLRNRHWTTLVIAYNPGSGQFRAYYCDSFSAKLPRFGSQRSNIENANEIKNDLMLPLNKQAWALNTQGKKEMSKDVQETAQMCKKRKDGLVNIPINTDSIVSALEAALGIGNDDIRSSSIKQQNDGYNCGIFALENAHKITQMFKENKSFDEIDAELSKYKPDLKQLKEKRKEFAEALMNDTEWKEHLKYGLLCDLPPSTQTSIALKEQNVQACTPWIYNKKLPLTPCPCR